MYKRQQQQRVLLARALCAARKMMVLDEPVSGLDPKVTAEMYAFIEKLNREDGITIIMVSHDIEEAIDRASHVPVSYTHLDVYKRQVLDLREYDRPMRKQP